MTDWYDYWREAQDLHAADDIARARDCLIGKAGTPGYEDDTALMAEAITARAVELGLEST